MKRLTLISLMVLVMAGLSFASEDTTDVGKRDRRRTDQQLQKVQERQEQMREKMQNRQQEMKQKMEQRNEQFEAKIKEIRAIAQGEGATKTVAALDKFLTEHQKQVAEQKKQAEARRQEMQQQRQERMEQRQDRGGRGPRARRPNRPAPEDMPEGDMPPMED